MIEIYLYYNTNFAYSPIGRFWHLILYHIIPTFNNPAEEGFGWLVVLGFNATLTAKVISWRSVTHMCFLAYSHQY